MAVAACTAMACHPVNTVPPPATPEDPVQEFNLELPPDLEVRHIDFTASEYATDAESMYSGKTGGRAFIKVFAVDRETGESVLLLYENVGWRKQPLQIIRFRSAGNNR